MKCTKISVFTLSAALLLSGCSMSNTAKGGPIGGASGGGLGAAIGAIAGGGKGATIGALIGTAVGAGAGVLIGKKMDKAKAAAEAANAEAEVITDEETGLSYVKATFSSGILFSTGQYALSSSAKTDLATFAQGLSSDMDLQIYGYTDNDPWKGCTTAQSQEKNKQLSLQRATAVRDYLLKNGISSSQILELTGYGEENPVASNETAAGKEQNRRVEIYILPSDEMIEAANAEAAK